MRWIRWFALGILLIALGAGGARAGDDEADGTDVRAAVLTRLLEVLHARLEAQLDCAATLREAGRPDEALAAYAELDALFEKEMTRITSILDCPATTAAPVRIPAPRMVVREAPPEPRVAPENLVETAHASVRRALAWLAAHQSASGGWEAAGFHKWCRQRRVLDGPGGPGKELYDVGVTGLALLAFLRGGYAYLGDDYASVVGKALHFLKNVQDAEGRIGLRTSRHYIYNHGTAALALVTAYRKTQDKRLQEAAQKALDFVALSRNPHFAWRYGVKPGDDDASVTGWMIQTLAVARDVNRKAEAAGLPGPFTLDEGAFDGPRAWVDKMTDPDYGRTGYIQRGGAPARPQDRIDRFPGDRSEAMTAVGIVIRIAIGEDPKKREIVAKGTELIARLPPKWKDDGSIDMYYWYYGTHALAHVGGREGLADVARRVGGHAGRGAACRRRPLRLRWLVGPGGTVGPGWWPRLRNRDDGPLPGNPRTGV